MSRLAAALPRMRGRPRFQATGGHRRRQAGARRRSAPHDPDRGRQPVVEVVQRSGARSTWSSSPTGRTCRCRSPACASSRRAPSSASPPAGSFPRRRRCSRTSTAIGLTEPVADYIGAQPTTCSATRSASTPPGSWTSGASTGAASSRRRPCLLASVADYQAALVSLTAEVARTYVAIRTSEVLIRQAQDNARVQEEALGIAQSRFKNGATSELDPTQASDAAREHAGHDPAAAGHAAAAAQRAHHAARAAGGHHRAAAGGTEARSRSRPRRWRSACPPRCCGAVPTSAAPR